MSSNIGSFHIEAHTLLPTKYVFHPQVDWPPEAWSSESPPRVPSPCHSTQQCSCYPAVLYICLILSLLSPHWVFKLRQESYALSGQQGTWVFLREKTFTFTMYAWQSHSAQKPERSALIQIPGFSSSLTQRLPRVYEIVPCCTCTIHKGYYIVLHSSSILQISLFCIQPPFHPLNKSFQHWCSKATFKFDGLPTTVCSTVES